MLQMWNSVGRSADGQFSSALSASVLNKEEQEMEEIQPLIRKIDQFKMERREPAVHLPMEMGEILIVTATDIEVVGTSADGQFRSGSFASVEPDATGNSNLNH